MITYFESYNKKDCNGCGVCELICPKKCIKMIKDNEGFLYPQIDKDKCINCGKCRRVCSNFPKKNENEIKAYATKNKNEIDRKNSTSGGMFKILAEYVINNDGVVFGVELNKDLIAQHNYAETMEECRKFSTSKYVRSDLNNSYPKVKEFLSNGRKVLFTGTPCQIQGLRNYLGKDNEDLILCEIICHANPSPKILEMYLKGYELKYGKKIKNIYFRSKNPEMNNSAYIEFEDGTKVSANTYIRAFTGEQLINRPSCNSCKFVSSNRKADFTIGDFWGVKNIFPEFDYGKGVSLLTVNTLKAKRIFNNINDKMIFKESDLEKAFSYNHNSNLPQSKKRRIFFDEINNGIINENNIIEKFKEYTKMPLHKKIIGKCKSIIKRVLNIKKNANKSKC